MVAKKKSKSGGGFWRGVLLFALGFTAGMGAAAGIAVYINELHLPFIEPPTRKIKQASTQQQEQAREEVQFHDILKNKQPVPVEAQPAQPPADDTGAPALSRGEFVFYLQIGAFAEESAAETLRGEFVLRGQNGIVKSAQLADGKTVFRVWLGPFNSELAADETRAQLTLDGYPNATLLKVRL